MHTHVRNASRSSPALTRGRDHRRSQPLQAPPLCLRYPCCPRNCPCRLHPLSERGPTRDGYSPEFSATTARAAHGPQSVTSGVRELYTRLDRAVIGQLVEVAALLPDAIGEVDSPKKWKNDSAQVRACLEPGAAETGTDHAPLAATTVSSRCPALSRWRSRWAPSLVAPWAEQPPPSQRSGVCDKRASAADSPRAEKETDDARGASEEVAEQRSRVDGHDRSRAGREHTVDTSASHSVYDKSRYTTATTSTSTTTTRAHPREVAQRQSPRPLSQGPLLASAPAAQDETAAVANAAQHGTNVSTSTASSGVRVPTARPLPRAEDAAAVAEALARGVRALAESTHPAHIARRIGTPHTTRTRSPWKQCGSPAPTGTKPEPARTRPSPERVPRHTREAALRAHCARVCDCYWSLFPDVATPVNPASHAPSCPCRQMQAAYEAIVLASTDAEDEPRAGEEREREGRSSSHSSRSRRGSGGREGGSGEDRTGNHAERVCDCGHGHGGCGGGGGGGGGGARGVPALTASPTMVDDTRGVYERVRGGVLGKAARRSTFDLLDEREAAALAVARAAQRRTSPPHRTASEGSPRTTRSSGRGASGEPLPATKPTPGRVKSQTVMAPTAATTAAQAVSLPPGPGDYNIATAFQHTSASRSEPRAVFARAARPLDVRDPKAELPGPGAYHLSPPLAPITDSSRAAGAAALALGQTPTTKDAAAAAGKESDAGERSTADAPVYVPPAQAPVAFFSSSARHLTFGTSSPHTRTDPTRAPATDTRDGAETKGGAGAAHQPTPGPGDYATEQALARAHAAPVHRFRLSAAGPFSPLLPAHLQQRKSGGGGSAASRASDADVSPGPGAYDVRVGTDVGEAAPRVVIPRAGSTRRIKGEAGEASPVPATPGPGSYRVERSMRFVEGDGFAARMGSQPRLTGPVVGSGGRDGSEVGPGHYDVAAAFEKSRPGGVQWSIRATRYRGRGDVRGNPIAASAADGDVSGKWSDREDVHDSFDDEGSCRVGGGGGQKRGDVSSRGRRARTSTPGPAAYMPVYSTRFRVPPAYTFGTAPRTTVPEPTPTDGNEAGEGDGGDARRGGDLPPPLSRVSVGWVDRAPRETVFDALVRRERCDPRPGPGDYDAVRDAVVTTRTPHALLTTTEPRFAPTSTSPEGRDHGVLGGVGSGPGPGSYDLGAVLAARAAVGGTIASAPRPVGIFSVAGTAWGAAERASGVGPGDYEPPILSTGPTWTFPHAPRTTYPAHPREDAAPGPGIYHVGEALDASSAQRRAPVATLGTAPLGRAVGSLSDTVPGPGSYDPEMAYAYLDGSGAALVDAAVGPTLGGRAPRWEAVTGAAGLAPGPGSYAPMYTAVERAVPGAYMGTASRTGTMDEATTPAGAHTGRDTDGVSPAGVDADVPMRDGRPLWGRAGASFGTAPARGVTGGGPCADGTGDGPGPGAYLPLHDHVSGGAGGLRFGTAPRHMTTETDGPGPGSYEAAAISVQPQAPAYTFGKSPAPGRTDAALGHGHGGQETTPGPGAYHLPPSGAYGVGGARSTIERAVSFPTAPRFPDVGASGAGGGEALGPGPAAYALIDPSATHPRAPAVAMGTAPRGGMVEAVSVTGEAGPGPGDYDVTRALGTAGGALLFSQAPRFPTEDPSADGGPASLFDGDPAAALRVTRLTAPAYSFGKAPLPREGVEESGLASPGPGAYDVDSAGVRRLRYASPRAAVMGAAPVAGCGDEPGEEVPGPGYYHLPPTFPSGPRATVGSAPTGRGGGGGREDGAGVGEMPSPGPGDYNCPLPQDTRGGPAVSMPRAPRFPPKTDPSLALPGPGDYTPAIGGDGGGKTIGGPGARFAQAARLIGGGPYAQEAGELPGPGPGDYDVVVSREGHSLVPESGGGGAVALRLTAARFGLGSDGGNGVGSGPGPATYAPDGAWGTTTPTTTPWAGARAPSFPLAERFPRPSGADGAAESGVGPGAYDIPVNLRAPRAPVAVLGTAPRQTGDAAGAMSSPGPGAYDVANVRESDGPAFSMLPRRPIPGAAAAAAVSPGPAAYAVNTDAVHPRATAVSMAGRYRLDTDRAADGPGPASYDTASAYTSAHATGPAVSLRGRHPTTTSGSGEGPGPASYDPVMPRTMAAPVFGTQPRMPAAGAAAGVLDGQGPGSYDLSLPPSGPALAFPTAPRALGEGVGAGPGPGDYDVASGSQPGGGPSLRFGTAPREVGEAALSLADTPGPGAYSRPAVWGVTDEARAFRFPVGPRWADGAPTGETWESPGPGAYLSPFALGIGAGGGGGGAAVGPSMSRSGRPELVPRYAAETPGPGTYLSPYTDTVVGNGGWERLSAPPVSAPSPGPGAYYTEHAWASQLGARAPTFATVGRRSPVRSDTPGPGAYFRGIAYTWGEEARGRTIPRAERFVEAEGRGPPEAGLRDAHAVDHGHGRATGLSGRGAMTSETAAVKEVDVNVEGTKESREPPAALAEAAALEKLARAGYPVKRRK